MGLSFNHHDSWTAQFVTSKIPAGSRILDIGTGAGKYGKMFGGQYHVDGIEVFTPSIEKFGLKAIYKNIFNEDARTFDYSREKYDLVIMGDVLEHLTVADATQLIAKVQATGAKLLILVPWEYEQDALYGNDAEIHHQPDLTKAVFEARYPGFTMVKGDRKQGIFFK